jgi:hypothetical protein
MSGRLQVRPSHEDRPFWVSDGGIIDNAPFEPVLDRITRRPADTTFKRLLVYVVPSRGNAPVPTLQQQKDAEQVARKGLPPEWPSVLGAALSLPRESDFRGDIAELDALLRAGDTLAADSQTMFENAVNSAVTDGPFAAADWLLPTYRRGRVAGGIWDARAAAGAGGPRVLRQYDDDDTKLSDAGVHELGPRWVDPALESVQDIEANPWRWGLAAAERCLRLMSRHLQHRIHADESQVRGSAGDVAQALARLEAVRDLVENRLAALRADEVATVGAAVEAVNRILADIDVETTVGTLMTAACDRYVDVTATSISPLVTAFAVEVCARALNARAPFQRTAPFTFLRIGPDSGAAVLNGTDLAGESPDALAAYKLYGTRAWHFAAFGNSTWRRWDWLWGRLDAVTHLAGPPRSASPTARWIPA